MTTANSLTSDQKALATLRAKISLLTTRDEELRTWLHERLDACAFTRESDVFEEVLDWLENHP
jgi:hypothetical protein